MAKIIGEHGVLMSEANMLERTIYTDDGIYVKVYLENDIICLIPEKNFERVEQDTGDTDGEA